MDDILSFAQCDRFYKLRDALAIFAHAWLGLEGEILVEEDPPLFDEDLIRAALERAFEDPSVIDAFVRENPFRLTKAELDAVSSWKSHLDGHFTVFEHTGKLLFMQEGRIFHVIGLYEPIRDVLGGPFPTIVQATLLPFEGGIVYSGFLMTWPIQMGANMARAIEGDIAQTLKTGEHVTSADRLIELVPVIAEERIKREAERMVDDLELDMKANQQLPGHHEGALAGMTEDEREAAIRAHMEDSVSVPFDFEDYLSDDTTKGPVRRSLAELIKTEPKEKLRGWASLFGLPHGPSLTKARLAESLTPLISASDFLPTVALQDLMPNELESYRKLYDEGGFRRVQASGITTLKDVPPVFSMLCYQFREDDSFVFVIPDEIMTVLADFDWEDCERIVRDFRRSADIADAMTALRGIVTMGEAYDEFKRCYPDGFGPLDFENGVLTAMERQYAAYDVLDAGDERYLVNFEIGNQFRRENGIEEDDFPDPYLEGDLGSLEMFLEGHKGKVARTLDENMRTSNAVFDWRLDRPAVRAMRNYLDAHVPDGADDYFFADNVVEDLVDVMSAGLVSGDVIGIYFDVLDDHGFQPDEAHLRKVVDLMMNMVNAMPTWMNNGWAPNELREAHTGQKVFYNEDGSMMKVGRNDPCPCGSGKKYKKCCGR